MRGPVRGPVRGLVREGKPATEGVEGAAGDLRDPEAVRRAMEGVDTVFHVAAAYRSGGMARRDYFDINVGGCSLGGPPTFFDPYRIHNLPPRKTGDETRYQRKASDPYVSNTLSGSG